MAHIGYLASAIDLIQEVKRLEDLRWYKLNTGVTHPEIFITDKNNLNPHSKTHRLRSVVRMKPLSYLIETICQNWSAYNEQFKRQSTQANGVPLTP